MSRNRVRLAAGAAVSALALGALPATAVAQAPAAAPAVTGSASSHHSGRHHGNTIRQIPLQGAVNVRDVGGYRTYDGDKVRYGLVYRADALGKLTDADVKTLAGLRLGKVVDYRVPVEIQYDGQDRLPAGLAVTARPVNDSGLYGQMMGAIATKDPVKQEAALGGTKGSDLMKKVYGTLISDPANTAQFAQTFQDIARSSSRSAVLFHCTSGKDRTGWTTYVLLRALGVPEQTARRDYLASNTIRAAADKKVREGLKQAGMMQNPDLLIPLQEVRDAYLDTALAEVTKRYGSFNGYLKKGLGLDHRALDRLQDRLTD
ncbi:protein-tyrosine-phosphatase [Streptomyces spiroverticillatus]|uniref:Protein-tyrosine-phosphatase n=1 Tax=Streptomyces finlayi TaxID=67296 RepID=A0A918WXD2_9ACTN|nr:tyrosine-protein phosphatase [Streptomyces finlayi]GGZ92579.1 protein-tyrosine-phosphatase [Streptomyces spiroverticillatus]GHC92976.1 protein-tyrosine-phosphatase [Streptomyces finlayi]